MTRIQMVSPMWPGAEGDPFGVFVANVARGLEARGFEVERAAVIRGKRTGARDKTFAHLALGGALVRAGWRPADCLYVHAPTWFAPLVELARLAQSKTLVLHLHGAEVYPGSNVEHLSRRAVAWLARRADLVIAPSRYYAEETRAAFGVDRARMFVSPSGGVDLELFRPLSQSTARAELGLPRFAEVLGYVGRIDRGKGWDLYLDVFEQLAAVRPNLYGLVIGEGPEQAAFDARVRVLGRGASARLATAPFQAQSELPAVYAAMDVLLFPARRAAESLGLVPIEALATGVPVIGSRIAAVPEYVQDGRCGYLCSPWSATDFAARAAQLLNAPPETRAAFSAAAREAASSYDARRAADELAAALRAAIDAR